jgi:hypothetical protein
MDLRNCRESHFCRFIAMQNNNALLEDRIDGARVEEGMSYTQFIPPKIPLVYIESRDMISCT